MRSHSRRLQHLLEVGNHDWSFICLFFTVFVRPYLWITGYCICFEASGFDFHMMTHISTFVVCLVICILLIVVRFILDMFARDAIAAAADSASGGAGPDLGLAVAKVRADSPTGGDIVVHLGLAADEVHLVAPHADIDLSLPDIDLEVPHGFVGGRIRRSEGVLLLFGDLCLLPASSFLPFTLVSKIKVSRSRLLVLVQCPGDSPTGGDTVVHSGLAADEVRLLPSHSDTDVAEDMVVADEVHLVAPHADIDLSLHDIDLEIPRGFVGGRIRWLGRTPDFLIYGHGQQRRAAIEAVRLLDDKKSEPRDELCQLTDMNSPQYFKERSKKWLKFVTQVKSAGKTPDDYYKVGNETGAAVLQSYNDILKSCNALDYHDLISCSAKLLTDFPEVFEECQELWKAMVIDEFQDTSAVQYELLRILASHKRITIVGDEDQYLAAQSFQYHSAVHFWF
ncbi:hypothetical protein T459_04191 [Capsicum annuum]|uniref:UvrD-like helicase ATP-binding domain-containing protein n=1 Tax=Capsicum annuum TaxID=4072 RepID=A0A2G3A4D4_CAPAN|nr:hypothetical protein T459_04191 [Capsicum annuum]